MLPDAGKVEQFLQGVFGSINMPEPHKSYWARLLSRPVFWAMILVLALGALFYTFPGLRTYVPLAQESTYSNLATTSTNQTSIAQAPCSVSTIGQAGGNNAPCS